MPPQPPCRDHRRDTTHRDLVGGRRPAPWGVLSPLVVLALLAVATPALAHPFGPPPTALLRADGQRVLVDWRSAPDDAAAIGVELGLMHPSVLDQYLEAPTQVAPSASDEDALAASPALQAYLRERIVVRQAGQPCDLEVVESQDFVHSGARLSFRCPAAVREVEIEISMLHDVHEAYRTFGIAESEDTVPAQAAFTREEPRHAMDFSGAVAERRGDGDRDSTGGGRGDAPPAGLAVLAAVLLAGAFGGVLVAGRGRR